MGDLIRMPHSELHATIELLDRLGVTPHDFEVLRKASSWSQATTARVHKMDPSVWAALELGDAAVGVGFTPSELRELAGRKDLLELVRPAVRGQDQVIVDCDAEPFKPKDWKVEEHKKGGQLLLNLPKIKLHFSLNQQGGRVIEGNKLRKELVSESVLNANVLDYLLAYPKLIPEDWKRDANGNTRHIFFWGTIYRSSHGFLCVLFLSWDDGAWFRGSRWLESVWRGISPAAVLAS